METTEPTRGDILRNRFKEMERLGKQCKTQANEFKRLLQAYRTFDDRSLEDYVLYYLRTKLGKKPLRAYYTKKTYEYIVERISDSLKVELPEVLFQEKLPFIFEVVITIQYLHNQILDEKYGVNTPKEINKNLITANILRELLSAYLHELSPSLGVKKHIILQTNISKLFMTVDIGQRMDKKYNHYKYYKEKNFPPFTDCNCLVNSNEFEWMRSVITQIQGEIEDRDTFIELYFRRIYKSNVVFFLVIVDTILELLDCSKEQFEDLRQYAVYYGFMLQVINDYADFAYSEDKDERKNLQTAGRKTTDFFSDLRNKNITLPLIYHLNEGKHRNIEEYLQTGRKEILTDYAKVIKHEFVMSGAFRASVKISRLLADKAMNSLCSENDQFKYLKNMAEIAYNNKFYNNFNI